MGASATKMRAKPKAVGYRAPGVRPSVRPGVRLGQVWQLLGGEQVVSESDLNDLISEVKLGKLAYDAAESVLIAMASSSSHEPTLPCSSPTVSSSAPSMQPEETPHSQPEEGQECMFCMECPRSMIWEGCGHVLYCEACSRTAPPGCPLCGSAEPAVPLGDRPCLTYCRRCPA